MKHKCMLLLLIFSTAFHRSHGTPSRPISHQNIANPSPSHHQRETGPPEEEKRHAMSANLKPSFPFLVAGVLSFMAAVVSSVGGIGGGGLFIPILTIVTRMDLKTASSFSAFMVMGGSASNVAYRIFDATWRRGGGGERLINYDIALLTEPCMLLGVSCGVICNQMFPEWLITVIFGVFLSFSTYKTCRSGVECWKSESEIASRNRYLKLGSGEEDRGGSTPLIGEERWKLGKLINFPWTKLVMLVIIWFSFLALYLFRGNGHGRGIIHVEACGRLYWTISSIQVPLALIFTLSILYINRLDGSDRPLFSIKENGDDELTSPGSLQVIMPTAFPVMALLAGILGGVFGIGGGMLISPLLFQLGMEPKETAATCSFMVLFSSSMSSIQYLVSGMEEEDIYGALVYAAICFVASIVGMMLVQNAVMERGRASIVVLSVGIVMGLSTLLVTSFGAVDVWMDYTSGNTMGFNSPC